MQNLTPNTKDGLSDMRCGKYFKTPMTGEMSVVIWGKIILVWLTVQRIKSFIHMRLISFEAHHNLYRLNVILTRYLTIVCTKAIIFHATLLEQRG